MTHDRHDERQPSTWWVGRGIKPRRWWADGALVVAMTLGFALNVSFQPSAEGWSLVVGMGAAVGVVLLDGYAQHHEIASWLILAASAVFAVYVISAGIAWTTLDLGVWPAVCLAIPLMGAAVCVGGAWRRRRRA